MKQFTYIVKNPLGIHVRPSGLIAKQASEYPDTVITITCGPETVIATSAIKLVSLGVKKGDTITLTCEGEYEQDALEVIGELITNVL